MDGRAGRDYENLGTDDDYNLDDDDNYNLFHCKLPDNENEKIMNLCHKAYRVESIRTVQRPDSRPPRCGESSYEFGMGSCSSGTVRHGPTGGVWIRRTPRAIGALAGR